MKRTYLHIIRWFN